MAAERRDGKLESFLHKQLPAEEYERLLTRQPCVATVGEHGAAEKPAHRHAVLGHRSLYLTDVPPKSLRMSVQLRDVDSVQILNEPIKCLQGRDKDNAVHVQIHFTRTVKHDRGPFGSLGNLSPALEKRLGTTSSKGGSGDESIVKKTERMSLPSPLLTRNKSSSFDQQGKCVSLSPAMATKHQTSTELRTDHHPISYHITPPSPNMIQRVSSPLRRDAVITTTSNSLSSPFSDRKQLVLEISPKSRLLPSPQSLTLSKTISDCSNDVNSLNSSSCDEFTTDDSLCSSQSSPSLLVQSANHSNHLQSRSLHQSGTWSSERDLRKSELLFPSAEKERDVLNLYLLTPTTDFFHHLCTAWQNQKIATTLELGHLQPVKSLRQVPSDHFHHHFHTLRQELVSATTVEDSTRLALELCSACKRYFIIKQLFWESHGLLEFLIEALQYTPYEAQVKDNQQLHIEIEYRVVVLDVIYQMMKETQGLQRKCHTLTANYGKCLRQLSSSLLQLTSTLTKNGTLLSNEDVVIELSCGILSEIFKLTQQMRWPCSSESVVSPEWIVDILAKHPQIRHYCGVVIAHIISSTLHLDKLEPHNLVSLYHMISVVNFLINHSPRLLDLIHTQFAEEFKYYLSVTQARKKLPVNSPLTTLTISLLQTTKHKVLKK